MKIVNFGSCNIDHVYSVAHIVRPGETVAAGELEVFPGGKGLNQSIALARAGAAVYHAGCIGRDGQMLRDVLKKDGVLLDYLNVTDGPTGHAIIQLSDDGENAIVLYGGGNRAITKAYVDAVLSHFAAGDVLLLQNEINHVDYIVDRAFEIGMTVAFNAAPFGPEVAKIDLSKLTYLIVNKIEAAGIGGKATVEENLAEIRRRYPSLAVVLTLGKQGCLFADGKRCLRHPIYDVDVVDTTGAGDTFTGYFLASVLSDGNVEAALQTASAASALAVSKKGAATSIPYMSEVKKALTVLKTRE